MGFKLVAEGEVLLLEDFYLTVGCTDEDFAVGVSEDVNCCIL